MSTTLSNNIKACLFIGDMLQPLVKITTTNVYTLQTLFYQTARRKDEQSIPYGPPMRSILDCTIRTLPDGYLKQIYEGLTNKEEQTFSIIMNAYFQEEKNEFVLKEYDNAFMVSGYIIGVEELYKGKNSLFTSLSTTAEENEDQMLTRIQILINAICYLGDNNRNITFYIK